MANLGDIKIALDYQVQKQGPLDARLTRKTKSELIDINAWPHEGNVVYVYKTMLVGIEDTGETYKLIDPSKMFESDYSGWKLVNSNLDYDVIGGVTPPEDIDLSAYATTQWVQEQLDIIKNALLKELE